MSWTTDIGTSGAVDIPKTRAAEPTEYQPLPDVTDWKQFKQHVNSLEHRRYIFRGQRQPLRLRTAYHRTERADLTRFLNQDIQTLHRHLSQRTTHIFNLSIPEHFSIMEFMAIDNERLIPQQSISSVTNVDDIETYIRSTETGTLRYLGRELDKNRLGKSNLIVMKSAIDRHVNSAARRKTGQRSDLTRPQLDEIEKNFPAIVEKAVQEVFNAAS